MSPELIAAIKERITRGYSKENIKLELNQAGYNDELVEAAYSRAEIEIQGGTPMSEVPLPAPVQTGPATLPSVGALLSEGWEFAQSRMDYAGLLALPALVIFVIDYLSVNTTGNAQQVFSSVSPVLIIMSVIFYILTTNALLYVATHRKEREIGFNEAFNWSKGNFFGLLWVSILTGLAVFGGMLLMIIPGIIVAVSLYLAQYVYVKEGLRGMDALMRSRELVRGNWWSLAIKLVLLGLVFFGILAVLSFIIGLSSEANVEEMADGSIFELFMQIFQVITTIVFVPIGLTLYKSLAAASPTTTTPKTYSGKWQYILLTVIGLFPLTLIFVALTGLLFSQGISSSHVQIDTDDSVSNKQQISLASYLAQEYFSHNSSSYLGVCQVIEPIVTSDSVVTCNESVDSFAISATQAGGEWCADSNGYNKLIVVPLQNKTTCLDFGQEINQSETYSPVESEFLFPDDTSFEEEMEPL